MKVTRVYSTDSIIHFLVFSLSNISVSEISKSCDLLKSRQKVDTLTKEGYYLPEDLLHILGKDRAFSVYARVKKTSLYIRNR